jgi:hypothetical protein
VNVEEEYHEEKSVDVRESEGAEKGTGRAAPITPRRKPTEMVLPYDAEAKQPKPREQASTGRPIARSGRGNRPNMGSRGIYLRMRADCGRR